MKGQDDEAVHWPFVGKILVTIKNPIDELNDFTETMTTPIGLSAFERPLKAKNPVGYGLQEFIRVNSLYSGGYIVNNTVMIVAKVVSSHQ